MKLETTLERRTAAASKSANAAAPAKNNLRKISPLRPAKLTAGRNGGLAKGRGARRKQDEDAPTPVVVLPEGEVGFDRAATELQSNDVSRGDNLQLYLREIGQLKLLTPDEEIVLARRIQKGDEEAREHMIKANLRLVVKIARDYEGLGLPLLDLINEGNIGLMKGVERFNPAKGAKLSTYAALWTKQSIRRALGNQSKTIRLP